MRELDGTANLARLGANAVLAASVACALAQCEVAGFAALAGALPRPAAPAAAADGERDLGRSPCRRAHRRAGLPRRPGRGADVRGGDRVGLACSRRDGSRPPRARARRLARRRRGRARRPAAVEPRGARRPPRRDRAERARAGGRGGDRGRRRRDPAPRGRRVRAREREPQPRRPRSSSTSSPPGSTTTRSSRSRTRSARTTTKAGGTRPSRLAGTDPAARRRPLRHLARCGCAPASGTGSRTRCSSSPTRWGR